MINYQIIKIIIGIGGILSIITPATLIIGIIKSIKATEKREFRYYMALAIISAYLLFIPLLWMLRRLYLFSL